MTIINYTELEKPIKEVEEVLKDYDMEETQLILRKVGGRIAVAQQQRQIKENTGRIKEIKGKYKKNKGK